jgi:hypothetical protein
MAESGSFDATVPAMQDSNWLFYSRDAKEQPRGNQGNEIFDKALGTGLEKGAEVFDRAMEDHVRNTVFDVEQKDRMQFINAADALAQDKGAHSPNILEPTANTLANAPPQVQATVARVKTVQAATDANKLDKFGYFQRVIPDLQAVRQQYPGYRHVVDQALGNNANAEMNTIIQEINRKDSEKREDSRRQQSEVLNMAKEGFFGENGAAVVAGFNGGRVPMSTVLKIAAPFMARSAQAKAAQQNSEIYKWDETSKGDNMSQEAVKQFNTIGAGAMIWPTVAAGKNGPTSEEDIATLKTMAASGRVDPDKATAAQQRLEAHYNEAYQAGIQWASTPWANGDTPLKVMGEQKVKGLLEAQLSPLKQWIDFVGDPKSYPLAKTLENKVKFIHEGDELNALQTPSDMQRNIRNGYVLKNAFGEQGVGMAFGFLKSFPENLAAYMDSSMVDLYGGTPKPNGEPETVGSQVKWLKDHGVTYPDAYQGKLNLVSNITKPDTYPEEIRHNIAKAFFAPTKENRELMSSFGSSYYDGRRWRNGAEDAFKQVFNGQIAKQVMKFKDAKLSTDFQNAADANFRLLAERNIATLNGVLETESQPIQTTVVNRATGERAPVKTPPAIRLGWNTETNSFDVSPEARSYLQSTRQRGVLDAITRLQMLTSNMASIVQAGGEESGHPRDMRVYMLQLLQAQGLNINDLPVTKELQKAIEATAPQKVNLQ